MTRINPPTALAPAGEEAASRSGRKPELSIGFILVPDFTLTPFSALIDALRISADAGPGSRQIDCRWTIMGAERRPVTSSCGIAIEPWEGFQDPSRFHYIAVSGGLLHRQVFDHGPTFEYLRAAAAAGVPLIGLCTGAFILARAGLMEGRRAAIHWLHHERWAAEFPHIEAVVDRLFLSDRDRITCVGGTGAFDLALHLVERHGGPGKQLKLMQFLAIDGARPAEHRLAHSLAQIGDRRVRDAVVLMKQNLGRPLPLADLARRVGVSPRSLIRAFQTEFRRGPTEYARRLRLEHGLWLLRNTELAITDIAHECGFADASHFSRWCKAAYQKAPGELRGRRAEA